MKASLNLEQRRSVTITLRMFEEKLRQASIWLQEEETDGILYQRRLNLSPEQRELACQRIEAALNQIKLMANDLELEPEVQDLSITISSELHESWANLNDIRSKKLRRFGKVDPGLEEKFDPTIECLAQLALELASILTGHSVA